MTFDPRPAPPGRFSLPLLLAVGVCVAILATLGTWQMQRRAWKEGLLARIEALKAAPAEPLDVVLRRLPDQVDVEYVRVQTACPDLETLPTLRLYTVRDGMSGYRLIAACPVNAGPYSSILVDRGFIPREVADVPSAPAALQRPITGILHKGESGSVFTPQNRPGRDWYRRDVPAMAKALKADRPAPMFLMLENPAPHGPGPQPAPLPADIPNRHLEYALTWYGLAVALLGVYIAKLVRDRKA
ncbi:MAG TPA: SURF1 family cytochrome oxidase biogenesis protein [Caulobacteraceae bacterium]|jgi:surfeit locus 1 family protein|nr:SURF1 family cytochrome oxidase biogenesis protein [Caulobacteraceae bacterium]